MQTTEKTCFKCLTVKPLSDFYKHSEMADGHVNKCKTCNKNDVTQHRSENIERIREYDRTRANIPKRVAARKSYAQTDSGKQKQREGSKNYGKKYPYKKIATTAIGNAIRDGKIIKPKNCESCFSPVRINAHHDDYSKPLSVRWLCGLCHVLWHKENKPIYPF